MSNRILDTRQFADSAGGLLLLLAVYTLFGRWTWITGHPYPLDYDGFYYLVEIRSWLESGRGYYHQISFFFPFAAAFCRLFGLGEVTGVYSMVLVSLSLFAIGVALIGAQRCRWWLAAALFYLVIQSDILFYLFYGYLRQGTALAFTALGVGLLVRAQGSQARLRFLSNFAIALLLVGALFHIFSALLGLLLVIVLHADRFIPDRRRSSFAAALLFCCSLISLWVNPKALLSNLSPGSPAPVLLSIERGWLSPFELFEFAAYALAGVLIVFCSLKSRHRNWPLILIWALYLAVVSPLWAPEGGYWHRLLSSGPVFAMLGIAFGIKYLAPSSGKHTIPLFSVLLICFIAAKWTIPHAPRPIGPSMRIDSIKDHQEELRAWIPEEGFVLAPHGIQFRVTYFLRRSSAKRLAPAQKKTDYFEITKVSPGEACSGIASVSALDREQSDCLLLDDRWLIRKCHE